MTIAGQGCGGDEKDMLFADEFSQVVRNLVETCCVD